MVGPGDREAGERWRPLGLSCAAIFLVLPAASGAIANPRAAAAELSGSVLRRGGFNKRLICLDPCRRAGA